MKITLQKKADASDNDSLLVQYVEAIGKTGVLKKRTIKVALGESLDLPDDLAIEVMQRYRGLFSMASEENVSKKTRSLTASSAAPGYTDKALHAE